MTFSEKAAGIISAGEIKIRVIRSGMYQKLTFTVAKEKAGEVEYYELFTDRLIDASELTRIAEEVGLPVKAQNGRSFPKGTSARDFQVSAFQPDSFTMHA